MSLAILVPSRGRPANLRRLINAVNATTTGTTAIYVRLDNDDTSGYPDTIAGAIVTRGPRVFYGASVNELAAQAAADGHTHLAMFGDDVVPETPGWDTMLITALGGRLGIAYGSDGLEHLHGIDLPTHYITPTDVYRRLGWLILPTLRHLYADNTAREIGRGLGNLQYVPEAKLPHLHRWLDRTLDDQTYREANDKRKRELDRQAYETWRNGPGYIEAMKALTA